MLEPDPAAYERFAAGFPFTETADQARAIAAVRDDLASGQPMDRLVIGDVGYGKTEVALRAAALAALAGYQVARRRADDGARPPASRELSPALRGDGRRGRRPVAPVERGGEEAR